MKRQWENIKDKTFCLLISSMFPTWCCYAFANIVSIKLNKKRRICFLNFFFTKYRQLQSFLCYVSKKFLVLKRFNKSPVVDI